MKEAALVVMAAGMGSRFGGLKQLEPITKSGEVILDFSVHDAQKAGFTKAVFIIRKDIEADFRELVGKRIEKKIDVEYVFQDMNKLPDGFSQPEGRTKPWGTGHAVYCLADTVKIPFALINADDYYGQSSFKILYDNIETPCMVGFALGNTLTENGTVSRGICTVENGELKKIVETSGLDKNSGVPLETTVSMNMWGLQPSIFEYVKSDFEEFLKNMKNPLKDEFYIPTVIDNMIKRNEACVKVIQSPEKWYGVTYKEDKESVVSAINDMISKGMYKF